MSHRVERQVARDLVAQQGRDLAQQLAKALGRGGLVAHQGELVLHQRMVHRRSRCSSKHRPVARDLKWRRRRRRASRARCAARRPGPALEHARQRKLLRRQAESAPTSGASSIEQRHGQCAPTDHKRVRRRRKSAATAAGSRGTSTPMSTNSPPLRYSARPVKSLARRHPDARVLERLDQRVAQPLRQFVQRHVAACRPSPAQRRMRPTVPERHAAEGRPARPDRTQRLEQGFEDRGGRQRRRARCARSQCIEQAAGPRRIRDRKQIRPRRHAAPSRFNSAARPASAEQRIAASDLERALAAACASTRRSAAASARSGSRRIVRQTAAAETSAGWRAPALRTVRQPAGGGVAIAPARAGAGIEQHRGDHARSKAARASAAGIRPARCRPRPRIPQIAAAEHKMPPARSATAAFKSRIALAHDARDEIARSRPAGCDRPSNPPGRRAAPSDSMRCAARAPPPARSSDRARRSTSDRWSIVLEVTSDHEWQGVHHGSSVRRREIARGLFRVDLDLRIRGHELRRERRPARRSRSPHSIRASYLRLDIETSRSMRVTPSQCSTSGMSCWKRASCTPATHSVRAK